jgi:hypothetical protein
MPKRYYLDVNALNIPDVFKSDLELYFSAWGIFEILSGIKNDREFRIRKATLNKLKGSNIKIIPHFQSSLCAEIFAFEDWDENDDVKATLEMYERILNCASFEEYKKISFSISDNNKVYNHELFQKFDDAYSDDHTALLEELIKQSNDQKKKTGLTYNKYVPLSHLSSCEAFKEQNRKYAYDFAYRHLKEAIKNGNYFNELIKKINENNIFEDMSKIEKDNLNNQIAHTEYLSEAVELLQTYKGVQTIIDSMLLEKLKKSMLAFDNYTTHIRNFNFPTISQDTGVNAVLNSQHPARNDSQDLGHLYFIDHVDFFVSNDKLFNRIQCLKEKVIKLDEFKTNHLTDVVSEDEFISAQN